MLLDRALANLEKEWCYGAAAALIGIGLVELWRRNRKLPPGPWGLPLFGYYLFLRTQCQLQLGELAKKYGDVMSFRTLGGDLIIILNGFEVLKEVLVARSEEFIGKPLQTNLLLWLDDGLEERLVAISMNMLIEGTVSTIMCCLLWELSHHQEAQKVAQQELDTVVGHNQLPSWTDRQNLPYVEALILELYRTNQAFIFSNPYSNFEETVLRGYRIPKRSVIIANYWTINNNPKTFPQPSKFDPNRFLTPDGKRLKQDGPTPFGIGKRACVGESLAQMEVFICIASILQNFTLFPGTHQGWLKATSRNK